MPKKKQSLAKISSRTPALAGPSLSTGLRQAGALMERKRWVEARDILRPLAQRYPREDTVLMHLANVYLELNDKLGMEYASELLVKVRPNDPDALLNLAGSYLSNLRLALALRTFRRFLDRWPGHPRAAKARETVADLDPKLDQVLALHGLSGAETRALAELHEEVLVLLAQGHHRQARAIGERVLQMQPDFVPALNNISQTYVLDGRLDLAISTSQRVLEIDPDNFHALGNLIRYLCMSGRAAEAWPFVPRLTAADADSVDLWHKKLEALSFLGDDEGILEVFAQAQGEHHFTTGPNDARTYHLAAVAAWRLGHEADARRYWDLARKAAPGLTIVTENLDEVRKPIAERDGPWPFGFIEWLTEPARADLNAVLAPGGRPSAGKALRQGLGRFLQQHPEVGGIVPLLLDRGDPGARDFAVRLAEAVQTPDLLTALHDFALGQHGSDARRNEAARIVSEAGLFPPGPVRMWIGGSWRDILLMNMEIYNEPTDPLTPRAQTLLEEAFVALTANDGAQAEPLLKRALEVEPGNPTLLNNLALAYSMQGRTTEAEALTEQIFEQHPDYLFARVARARWAIQRGQLADARALLEPLRAQRRFHQTEFAAFCAAEVELQLAEKRPEGAQGWLDLWARVDPDNSELARLRFLAGAPGALAQLMRLAGRGRRS